MRSLLRVTMTDIKATNLAIKTDRLSPLFQKISDLIKPETFVFYSDHGNRAALFLFDLKESSMLSQIAEPFITELNAKVEIIPVMNVEELKTGLEAWSKESLPESQFS